MSLTADPIEDLSEVIQSREYSVDIFENIPAASQDELKTVLFYLRDEAYRDSDRALKALSEAEDILQQAYTGRYLFELIQNVRDANKAAEIEGSIYIKVEDGILTIANTGTAFTKKGFRSITTIGDSTKDSKDFIGFKGIGFKSIQEISDTPRIVTAYGTVVFDRNLSFKELAGKVRSIKDIPLFFIPHFLPETLTNEELQNNIVTKIVLPLRPGDDVTLITKGFRTIEKHQLMLLGNIKLLDFVSKGIHAFFKITNNLKTGKVDLETESGSAEYKRFSPSYKIEIPPEYLEDLNEKEKVIYRKDPFVDIVLLFDIGERRLQPIRNATLYMFNPLKIRSGFKFLIHSYFIVNAERTELRGVLLNEFLLERIADYLTGAWLDFAMRHHETVYLDFLAFDRNKETKILDLLYDRIISNLKVKDFIYDPITGKKYRYDRVIIGDGFDKGLFEDNRIGNKQLIYIKNESTRDWLTNEIRIEYLDNAKIREHIEKECERQRKKKNYLFFNRLYKYIVNYPGINFGGLKILLTSENTLRAESENVFYRHTDQGRTPLPVSIRKKIYFSHPDIKIPKFRDASVTGFQEYKTELLIRRLLNLFEDPKVPNSDILNTLLGLPITDILMPLIRAKILFPLTTGEWVKPLNKPVYLPSADLQRLYPESDFIDVDQILFFSFTQQEVSRKLLALGVWDIPALTFTGKGVNIPKSDERYRIILDIQWFTTPSFHITGDWVLHFPVETDEWFSQSVMNNWARYTQFIYREEQPEVKYKSVESGLKDLPKNKLIRISGFIHKLKTAKWMHTGPGSQPFGVREVVGIDPLEHSLPGSSLYKRFLKSLRIHQQTHIEFIKAVGLNHLDRYELDNWKNILTLVADDFSDLEVDGKDFVSFYHKLYGKLFDFYENGLADKETIRQLASVRWLSINDPEQKLEWKTGSAIFNMDDKPGYDLLPDLIKAKVQPQFTLRDKNRFGQISRQIGLSFKKEIVQRLEDSPVIREIKITEFIPDLPEAIALIESNVNGDFEKELERIRDTRVKIKTAVSVQIWIKGVFIQKLDVPYKIETGRTNTVHTIPKPESNSASFFAGVLHDFLAELLNRDLLKSKNLLVDYFSRDDKATFLRTYDVDQDRVEAIREKLTGHQFSSEQRFWLDVMNLKSVTDPLTAIYDNHVDFEVLAHELKIGTLEPEQFSLEVDFTRLNDPSVIEPVSRLFNLLGIDLTAYNRIAAFPLDFSEYYRGRFYNLLAKSKRAFETKLYRLLKKASVEGQAAFQQNLRKYDAIRLQVLLPTLELNLAFDFIKSVNAAFPLLKFTSADLNVSNFTDTAAVFRSNWSLLTEQALKEKLNTTKLDAFIDEAENRSLVYFGQIVELIRRYRLWLGRQPANPAPDVPSNDNNGPSEDLSGVVIEDTSITKVHVPEKTGRYGGWTGGKRLDGGAPSPHKDLIGRVSEKFVYEALLLKYQHVEWVSRNAAKEGVNAEGSDEFSYDISYIDEKDIVHFVEVKGSAADQRHFYISRAEIIKAKQKGDVYHVFYVPFALDKTKRRIRNLGNIFIFQGAEDIFNNRKFTATFETLEINFS